MTPLCRLSAYGLPPPGMNFSGADEVLAVSEVDLPQPAVPGHGVDRVFARRRLRHRRHSRLSARTERVVRAAGIGQRAVELPVPDLLPGGHVDPEQIVRDAGDDGELARAVRRGDAFGDERREEIVHRARLALELDLPEQLHAADVGRREHFLVAHPAGAAVVHAFGEEVRGLAVTADNSRMTMTFATRMYLVPRLKGAECQII